MYQTLWIDIQSGLENTTYEAVKEKVKKFKEDRGIGYAEIGMVFEEFDIFALFEYADSGALTKWILDEIAPLEGVVELKIGNLTHVDKPLKPLESKPFTLRQMSDGEEDIAEAPSPAV